MRKSLLATAAMLALAGMSSAQAADVEVYGLINTGFSYIHTDADVAGVNDTDTFSMENGKEFGSRFGLRGSEDLGNGLKVGFILESGFRSDDGTLDQSSATATKLFGREARLYVETPAGRFSFGNLPIFGSTLARDGLFRAIDPLFANYTSAFGSGYATASSWTRVDNAVSYVSPTFAGLTGYAMYSFKNSAAKNGTEGRGGNSDRYASAALRYQMGGLEAVLVADTTMYGTYREDAEANSNDGWTVTLGGNYTFANGFKVLAFVQDFGDQELNTIARGGVALSGIQSAATTHSYGFVDGWGASLGMNMPVLGGTVKGQVAYRDMDNQVDDSFKRITVCAGYDYPLSKRTAVYAMTGWSQEKIETATQDAKPNGYEFTFGIVHRF